MQQALGQESFHLAMHRMHGGMSRLTIPLIADLLDPDLLATHCTVQVGSGHRTTNKGKQG